MRYGTAVGSSRWLLWLVHGKWNSMYQHSQTASNSHVRGCFLILPFDSLLDRA